LRFKALHGRPDLLRKWVDLADFCKLLRKFPVNRIYEVQTGSPPRLNLGALSPRHYRDPAPAHWTSGASRHHTADQLSAPSLSTLLSCEAKSSRSFGPSDHHFRHRGRQKVARFTVIAQCSFKLGADRHELCNVPMIFAHDDALSFQMPLGLRLPLGELAEQLARLAAELSDAPPLNPLVFLIRVQVEVADQSVYPSLR
jgi:hypothetical protein